MDGRCIIFQDDLFSRVLRVNLVMLSLEVAETNGISCVRITDGVYILSICSLGSVKK